MIHPNIDLWFEDFSYMSRPSLEDQWTINEAKAELKYLQENGDGEQELDQEARDEISDLAMNDEIPF
jgi:hypothetical protein